MRRALQRAPSEAGLSFVEPAATAGAADVAPDAVVVDLDAPGALDELERLRRRFPETFIAGHVALPRREVWLEAERAGCDLVANRGAFAVTLLRRLPPPGVPRRQRVPLVEADELPGRIGLVLRAPDSPVGPLAVFHFSGALCGIADRCPHAGATLSEGPLEGTVVTCPRHGSQFDVSTGTRLRGPADEGIATFEIVEEDGFVYLVHGGPPTPAP